MPSEQDRTLRQETPEVSCIPASTEAGSDAASVGVVIASCRSAVPPSWTIKLAGQAGVRIDGDPVTHAEHLIERLERRLPEVLLLDKSLLDGLDRQSLHWMSERCHRMRVLLLWDDIGSGLVADVLRHRFHGFLHTNCSREVCLKAIRAVCRGELWLSRASLASAITDLVRPAGEPPAETSGLEAAQALTPRELQVVRLLRRGCINKEIASELGIMEDTVKKHLQSVFAKLGVHRRTLVALRHLPGDAPAHTRPHRAQQRGENETETTVRSRRVSAHSASSVGPA